MKVTDNDQTGDYETTIEINTDSYDPIIQIEIGQKYGGDTIKMNYADFCNIRDFIEGFERKMANIRGKI